MSSTVDSTVESTEQRLSSSTVVSRNKVNEKSVSGLPGAAYSILVKDSAHNRAEVS